MTNEQAQAYLKAGGVFCPLCKSNSIEGGDVEIEYGTATQQCGCNECGAEWTDSYHLAAVIDDEGNIYDKETTDGE